MYTLYMFESLTNNQKNINVSFLKITIFYEIKYGLIFRGAYFKD